MTRKEWGKRLIKQQGDSLKMDGRTQWKDQTVNGDTIKSVESTARLVLCFQEAGA